MSYDVSIGDQSFNYTSNIRELINDHIPGGHLSALHGMSGGAAVDVLSETFYQLNQTRHRLYVDNAMGEPAMCAKYDAANGWGSTLGAVIFLGQILGACAKFPDHMVEVSS